MDRRKSIGANLPKCRQRMINKFETYLERKTEQGYSYSKTTPLSHDCLGGGVLKESTLSPRLVATWMFEHASKSNEEQMEVIVQWINERFLGRQTTTKRRMNFASATNVHQTVMKRQV